jgi:hypothetical protein
MDRFAISHFDDKSRTRFNVGYLLKNYCSEDLRTTGVDSLRLNAEVELIPTHTKLTLSYLPYGEFRCILADEVGRGVSSGRASCDPERSSRHSSDPRRRMLSTTPPEGSAKRNHSPHAPKRLRCIDLSFGLSDCVLVSQESWVMRKLV